MIAVSCSLSLTLASTTRSIGAEHLKAPWPIDIGSWAGLSAKPSCAALPGPVLELSTQSRYDDADRSRSIVDPAKSAAYEKLIAPVRLFAKRVVELGNTFALSKGKDATSGYCGIAGLRAWADAGALKSALSDGAEFNRATFLSGVAAAYLQLRDLPVATPADKAAIETWLGDLAEQTRAFYDPKRHSAVGPNNIQYWAALGVGMAAVATNNHDDLAWALHGLELGLCTAHADGSLPRELIRKSRAREYHLFALLPLVTLSELAARNGLPGYELCGGALHRVVRFALASVDDPTAIEALAGEKQVPVGPLKSNSMLAWVEIYAKRFPDRINPAQTARLRPLAHTSLGGQLTKLYGAR